MDASKEAVNRTVHLCVAEREVLMKNLRNSLENDFLVKSGSKKDFSRIWKLINGTIDKLEGCHRKRLFEFAPLEEFVFRNALLYSFAVYTTIGYGNLFPRTVTGRVLTMVYAVLGIPLNVAFIADLSEILVIGVQRGLKYFRRHFPRTVTGRVLTMVYAVLGIPLNVAFIADLSEILVIGVQRGLKYFRRHVLHK
ncbi:unnamed protein product [Gongylonema pulchrum]|uniref:Ion_trans_2 domain-containing protein n=1 Tax=Gongylonema pulchrum TaxID=637853 RepID=A0A183EQR6_9BILA|nr:unnamed protein product [Gongylonema pulchrum]